MNSTSSLLLCSELATPKNAGVGVGVGVAYLVIGYRPYSVKVINQKIYRN